VKSNFAHTAKILSLGGNFMTTGNKGFTFIELMTVIAIIGLIAAIAIPNFIGYRNKTFCSLILKC